MPATDFVVHETSGFRYLHEGAASKKIPVILLHGMLGDLSNWTPSVRFLAESGYEVFVPVLPVYDLPLKKTSVVGLVEHVHAFMDTLEIDRAVLVGNSLGGHVAIIFAYQYPKRVPALILSGASGIYEVNIGTSTPRRQDREYIRERAAVTFYDPVHATPELVDEMYEIVNDRHRVLRLIQMARSTKKESVTEQLSHISVPTLLVWGRDDIITPPEVAEQFLSALPSSNLRFIDRCGHAPMLERPDVFNRYMQEFLDEHIGEKTEASHHASNGTH